MADKLSTFLNETYSGFVGSRGELGFTGSRGFTGSSGSGFVGSRGDTGFTGSQGPIGYTGSGGSGGGGAATEVGSSPPETPTDGQLWFDSDDASLSIYYDDGNTSQWVTVSGPRGASGTFFHSIVTDSSTSITPTLDQKEYLFKCTSASAVTFTLPAESSVNFPVGSVLHVVQYGTGQVTISPASGVTLNYISTKSPSTSAQYAKILAIKIASDEWMLTGDLS